MDEPREETFRGRCTAAQKQRWEKASRLAKRTLSDWMRIVLDEEAERLIARAEQKQGAPPRRTQRVSTPHSGGTTAGSSAPVG